MVKNTTGGSKHKSSARKHAAPATYSNRDPVPSSPFEKIAVVEKMLGNGMCQVITVESRPLTLVCHIRGKFRGKQKSQNIVSTKSSLLVGLRDWESNPKNCDLLAILSGNYASESDNLIESNNDVIFSNNLILDQDPDPHPDTDPDTHDNIDIDIDDI
jgi:hypothetical protein